MKTYLSAILFLFSLLGYAQPNLDSLWQVWQDPARPDSIRLQAIDKFTRQGYLFSEPDSAFYFAGLQLDFAKQHGHQKQMADAYNIQGTSYAVRGEFSEAFPLYLNALELYREVKNKKGVAGAYNNIGLIFYNHGDNISALDYYQKALALKEEVNDKRGIGTSLNNIGQIYLDQGENDKALEYFENSLKVKREINNKRGIAGSYVSLGNVYSHSGEYQKALDYYNMCLVIRNEIGDKSGASRALGNMGVAYSNLKEYNKALEYFEQGLALQKQTGDKIGVSISLAKIGDTYQKQKKYKKGIEKCQESYKLALNIGYLSEQEYSCQCLYQGYKALGNMEKSLSYLEKLLEIQDSLNANETGKKLQLMEFDKQLLVDSIARAEERRVILELHEKEMRSQERTRNFAFGAGFFVLVIAVGLYSRLRFTRKSKTILQKEKDRSENLLLNILPTEIAEELKEKGKADARDFDMVSILFTDFKDFTETSAKLSANDLVSEINTCFEAFDAIIEKYKIEKIKTIGDSYMSAGGLPVPTDDSVKNTVLAALEMQVFITSRKAKNNELGKPAFEMRVGIHTGPVVAGIVGVKKFQYDIWGDTVNTASRMESSGEVGKVNISQATYELLKGDASTSLSTGSDFTFESRGKIEAKGKGEIEMYFVSVV